MSTQKVQIFGITRPPRFHVSWTVDGKTKTSKFQTQSKADQRVAELASDGIDAVVIDVPPTSYLVKWRVDGRDKTRALANKARAEKFHRDLNNALDARPRERFDPETGLPVSWLVGDTVASTAAKYVETRWPGASETTRQHYHLVFMRVVLALLKPGTKAYRDPGTLEHYVRWKLLMPSAQPHQLTDEEQKAAKWLERYSLPIKELGPEHVMKAQEALSINMGQGRAREKYRGRPNAPSSVASYMTYVKAWVAMCLDLELVTRDPFRNAEVKKRLPKATSLEVSKDRAMTPAQAVALAETFAELTESTPRYRAAVLLICSTGLRIGEIVALRRRDLDLPETGWGAVTVRRQVRRVPNKVYSDQGKTVVVKPPKARKQGDAPRVVPIHPVMVAALRTHLAEFQPDKADSALVFTNTIGNFVDVGHFERDWKKAADKLWPYDPDLDDLEQHPLYGVTPHCGRHAAVSFWASAKIDPAVAARWSGHRRLSTFHDVYTHILDRNNDAHLQRLDEALRREAPGLFSAESQSDADAAPDSGDGEEPPHLQLVG